MASLLSFFGWAVLPNYATTFVQNVYYGITIRAGDPRPQPPSPRYERHRRRIFILVVTSYLLYTLYEVFHRVQVEGDFYRALGVSPLAEDKAIKSRFRRLAAQHHPDKISQGDGGPSETYFVYLKLAQDTLLDPARRFAYDRFGPDMVNWGDKKTMQGFLMTGLQRIIPHFYLLPFQILTLARRFSVTLHIFISQLTPPEMNKRSSALAEERLHPQTMQRLGQLVQAARATDNEATRLAQMGFAPFRGDREGVAMLRKGMKEGLVLGSVRASPAVQEAVGEVMERKRREKKGD
ncbi:hypothetical protein FE257_011444 [Aspergillus nanangensis]|uniref:J domain-containing protein n=1 Tax=Aspergillus nanangensis TaxID=2582783 RepID=A0AAD4CIW1_ASPNN|nr:hypothetical protein FE257_011444 [Aspergillus nanangensis]